jgi:hypothetical protein
MTIELKPAAPSWQTKVFPLLAVLGWALVLVALLVGLLTLTPTAQSYWGENAKSSRDAAEAGSGLITQLQTLSATPRWIEPLIFLGVASFMTSIAMAFSTIPNILKNRGQVMSLCFPLIVEQGE